MKTNGTTKKNINLKPRMQRILEGILSQQEKIETMEKGSIEINFAGDSVKLSVLERIDL